MAATTVSTHSVTVNNAPPINVTVTIGATRALSAGGSGSGVSLITKTSFEQTALDAHADNNRFTMLVLADVAQEVIPAVDESFILPNGDITPAGHKLTLQTGTSSTIGAYLDIIDVPNSNYRLIAMMRGTWLAEAP